MKYFNIVIQKTKDGAIAKTITEHETIEQAESAFHAELASGVISDVLAGDTCMVIDEVGNVFFKRAWLAKTEENAEA